MKTHIKVSLVLVVFQLALMPAWVSAEETHKRESCRVCGMWIDEYQKSAAELIYLDGKKEYSCGVACMLRILDDEGGLSAFKSVKVHDWVSGKLVDAETATYVLGSNVIPDMVPNYIAFAKREEAEAFVAKEGGEVIDFNIAYDDVSPVGTTAPFRIRTAVTPGKGNFSVGMVYGYSQKDNLKIGSNGVDPNTFIRSNKSQPQVLKEIQVQQQSLTLNYSPTDQLALFMNVPWFEKRLERLTQATPGNFGQRVDYENGLGDINIEGRYNLWRSTRWDQFATILLGTTLPTGHFDGNRTLNPLNRRFDLVQPAGLQLGKGTATFTGGMLYSQRWKDIWFHASALYNVNPENDDDYSYGDVVTGGIALHYTPNYDLMIGIEMDASYAWKNQDQGFNLGNSGGTTTNLAFVSDYRFLNALGGNFKLRGSIGLPIYEDLNYQTLNNPVQGRQGQYVQGQLGDGFFANLSVVWTYRAAPDY